jgi:hypothetical protein
MNTETKAERQERVRKDFYKKACDDYDEIERERLNKIFAALGSVESHFSLERTSIEKILDFSKTDLPLEEVRNGVESGDGKAILELLDILIDTLRAFENMPQDVRLAIADGLEKTRNRLKDRLEMPYRGAIEKNKRDPKQKEKTFILECWQQWQQSPISYPSKAAFARDMLTKCEYLKNQKKIEDWCREWEKPHPAS